MKIAFWSPMHGQACVTASMLSIAIMAILKKNKKILVTQTHYNMNNLETALVGKVPGKERDFFRDIGIDAVMRSIKSAPLTDEIIENCSLSFLQRKLSLLAGTKQTNRSVYEEESVQTILKILTEIEKYEDLVFIDTNSGNGAITKTVLAAADKIIVNLKQSQAMLDSYFFGDYQLPTEKVFYLFGAYDENSRYSMRNIRRRYREINRTNSGMIPYNIEYSDAFSDGRVIKYIERNYQNNSSEPSAEFIRGVEMATDILLRAVGVEE